VHGEGWRNAAAFGTWLVVGLPPLAEIWTGELGGVPAVAYVVSFVLFGAALFPCLGFTPWIRRGRAIAALLAVQTAAGLTMVLASGSGLAAATLVIVAAEAANVLPVRAAGLWVAAQSLLLGVVAARYDGLVGAFTMAGAFAGFQAFAVATVALAQRERDARVSLAGANAELLATRSLLAESSRVAERLRIARDLHDTLGHHLTALSLQLDVASRLTAGKAAEHVQQAHALTRLLLGDVRDVVSRMRDTSRIDLAEALRALAGAVGPLAVHLDLPDRFDVDDTRLAEALLRAVQEVITNAARHAQARHLWIRIEREPDGVHLHARDDGRGSARVEWGHGLRGMRERFEEQAGRLDVRAEPGRGFEVHGFLPRVEARS
jgi:signal transduction histidine kinase